MRAAASAKELLLEGDAAVDPWLAVHPSRFCWPDRGVVCASRYAGVLVWVGFA